MLLISNLFLWFDKEWQFKSLFEHDTKSNRHKMTSSIYVNGLQRSTREITAKENVEMVGKVKSDNIMLVPSNSSQEMSIKISQQKPHSLFSELRSRNQDPCNKLLSQRFLIHNSEMGFRLSFTQLGFG